VKPPAVRAEKNFFTPSRQRHKPGPAAAMIEIADAVVKIRLDGIEFRSNLSGNNI
jgi:hypothetical protein